MINRKYNSNTLLKKAHLTFPDNMPDGYKSYPYIFGKLFQLLLEVPMRCKLLDIGCNSGELSLMFKERNLCDVTAVDISENLVKLAIGKGIDVVCADAEKLPFANNTFDCVFLSEVIEHTFTPDKILKEAYRVLKKGGKIVGATIDEELLISKHQLTWDDERLHARPYGLNSMFMLVSKYFHKVKVYRNRCSDNVISLIFTGYKNVH